MPETVYSNSSLLTQVSSLIFDNVGILYASNYAPGTIIKIYTNGDGYTLTNLGSSFYISCITYYNFHLYAAVYSVLNDTSYIYKVNITDGTSILFSNLGPGISTAGIVYFQYYLYVVEFLTVNNNFNGVYKVDLSNGVKTLFISPSTITGIATNSNSYIQFEQNGYSYMTVSNSVLQFNSTGALISSTFINGSFGNILLFNNIFYLTKNTNQISQYNIDGTFITSNYATGGETYKGGGIVCDVIGNFYLSNETNGGGSGNVTINVVPNPLICFKEDTKILTDKGYIPIQELRKGDLVKTLKHDFKPIDMIGKKEIYNLALKERINDQLYKCSQPEYPEIFEPLILTGNHSVLVDNFTSEEQREKVIEILGAIYITDGKYRLPVCSDHRSSIYEIPGTYTIYHFALENDNYYMNYGIYANGLLVETSSKRYLKELSNMDLID